MRTRRSSVEAPRRDLVTLVAVAQSHRFWVVAGLGTVVSALAIAIPTRLVANSWFGRMTPTRPADYVFWVIASLLLGLVLALRRVAPSRPDVAMTTGGLGTVLAVGCPICNKLVVALLGVSGALRIFAPLQPLLGAASVVVLAFAVRHALRAIQSSTCETAVASAPPSHGAGSGEQVPGPARQPPIPR